MFNLEQKKGTSPKIAAYVRVSTMEQADLGHSLDVQKRRIASYADSNNWTIMKTFVDEGRSARTIDRPSFEALLDYCEEYKDTLDAVIVQDTSRLCRNVIDHLQVKAFLKKRNIKLISLEGNNDDTDEAQFLDLIIAGVNELESKRTGRKTKRVMVDMFERGMKPGQAPVGYINSRKKGETMYIDSEKEIFIKKAYSLWNSGNYSLTDISNILFNEGFRSINEKRVGKSGIQAILLRIDYAGGMKYDSKVNKSAQHKPIISMEEFEKARQVFELRNKGADRSRKHNTLLAGMVYCSKCKTLMHGDYHPKGNYYKCKNCGSPYARMSFVDDSIKKFFRGSAFTEKGLMNLRNALLEVKEENSEANPNQKESLENRKTALNLKMSKLEDQIIFGELPQIDKGRLDTKYQELKQQMEQVEKSLKNLEKPSNNLTNAEVDKIIWGLQHLEELYSALITPQKKQFLKFFITKVYVNCENSEIVDYDLVEEFEILLSRDLVRISFYWLRRQDSNLQPSP